MKQKQFTPAMQAINRQVAILKPKQPFLDWNLSLPDAGSLDLKFEDLHKDRTVWPEITLDNFKIWFDLEIHSVVIDLLNEKIAKEDW
ncbi:MAG: hypothetical protein Q7T03_08785 [Deltaproteobacteria bacterium]|nr:hypothetical protein [Deltaproteobacteria bacterium]